MVARAVTIFHHEEQRNSCCSDPVPPSWDPADDLRCITTTFQYLQTSGWYWGSISASKARETLLTKSEGTFLVRDSSHPQYMLALSVKTRFGPTSVRIEYSRGCFWLDSISPGLPQLQSFPDVLSLVQHYTCSGHPPQGQTSSDIHPQTMPDPSQHAAKDSGVPLMLKRPLHRLEVFPSLQHLARLTINSHTNRPNQLPLPKPLLCYLQDYPFSI
ncbi:cytokine-inducible SH2-containing protein-like [Archocentrus centrarchus]|uniref:Cytokine-inducible SH2-containing protein n=1 Tax=Amphilophus citrinellus TaxID=61819 RepID=A0A3Q0SVN2_AMPCI|nr:cytokine-inducible SH2-containing protein-like [Archocentrus centrarchus]XP_030585067.1 cytokine-inducible SH2-containing protein-like [Archocentrus centrarchus]